MILVIAGGIHRASFDSRREGCNKRFRARGTQLTRKDMTNNMTLRGVTHLGRGVALRLRSVGLGKPTRIRFPPRALPIGKEIKLKTTEIGSLTEMVRP